MSLGPIWEYCPGIQTGSWGRFLGHIFFYIHWGGQGMERKENGNKIFSFNSNFKVCTIENSACNSWSLPSRCSQHIWKDQTQADESVSWNHRVQLSQEGRYRPQGQGDGRREGLYCGLAKSNSAGADGVSIQSPTFFFSAVCSKAATFWEAVPASP